MNPFAAAAAAQAPAQAAFAASAAPAFAAHAASPSLAPGLGLEPPLDGVAPGFAYSMVKSGPDVSPDEVEVAHVSAIEVMILWDSNVLHVSHLTPPRSFYVGEESGDKMGCDYFIPSETLGTTRAPIVVSRGVGAALVILPRSRGTSMCRGKASSVSRISCRPDGHARHPR